MEMSFHKLLIVHFEHGHISEAQVSLCYRIEIISHTLLQVSSFSNASCLEGVRYKMSDTRRQIQDVLIPQITSVSPLPPTPGL